MFLFSDPFSTIGFTLCFISLPPIQITENQFNNSTVFRPFYYRNYTLLFAKYTNEKVKKTLTYKKSNWSWRSVFLKLKALT